MKPVFSMVLAGCALGLLVTACGGSTSSSSTTTTTTSAAPAATAGAMGAAAPAAAGAKVYDTNCSSCHGAMGQGSPGAFPPLAANPVVVGDAGKVIHIVKGGLTGKIMVAGHSYNGTMPAWGSSLSNGDIAAVITFVRSSWGNKAAAVTEAQVAAAK
jgi:mono/diheme cytochrome c family protein